MERFFFFPALVSEERPGEASEAIETPSYRCGWILQCSQPHQFLTPQFLHVLLLRLAFSFALFPDNTHEIQPCPVLERRCCVWKNGICWVSRDGVKTTVEETKQHSTYTVTLECLERQEMECTGHRSQVLKCILDAKDELCPAVKVKESLIDMTIREVDTQHMFSLAELAEALAEKKAIVVSQPGQKVARIDDLLYFEPYAYISPESLFSEENSKQVISEAFLEEVSATCYTKVDQDTPPQTGTPPCRHTAPFKPGHGPFAETQPAQTQTLPVLQTHNSLLTRTCLPRGHRASSDPDTPF